jgi:hypothetical protein
MYTFRGYLAATGDWRRLPARISVWGVDDARPRADRRRLRVSDADRDHVTELLRQAATEGRLTFDELDERLGQALAAKTYADLEAVTSDLPGAALAAPATGRLAARAYLPDRVGGTPGARTSVGIMTCASRAGNWVVPRRFTAIAVMGNVDLDLRNARFAERRVKIRAFCLMGCVNIIAPDDIEVDVSGVASDHRPGGAGAPGAPVVRVTGFGLMGGAQVMRSPAP